MFLKKFLFATAFILIAMIIGIAGYLYFVKQKPALAQTSGENIYISQFGSGSQNGSDCNNAYSVLWFNATGNWGVGASQISAGDTVHLCGIFVATANSTILTIQASGTSGNAIMILFEENAKFQAPYFSASGAINIGAYDYIKIDGGVNGIIENTDNGSVASGLTYNSSTTGIRSNGGANIEICNLIIQKLFINTGGNVVTATDITGYGSYNILIDDGGGSYSDINIHHNILKNSRVGISIGFEGLTISAINIHNNYFADHAWQMVIGAGVNNSVATGIDIYNNEMTDWYLWQFPTSRYHTDGLIIFSNSHTNASYTGKFRNNYVHGNLGSGSPSGFLGTGCGGQDFLIYNNLFICDNTTGGEVAGSCMNVYNSGGCYASQSDPNAGYQPINTQFYNNVSIGTALQKNNQGGFALKIARDLTNINGSGNYMQVKNNIFQAWNVAMFDMNANFGGFSGSGSSDNNSYYDLYPYFPIKVIRSMSFTTKSIAEFCSGYSQDCNSISGNPLFVSSSNFSLQAGSPAINVGTNLSSYFSTDYLGAFRPQGSAWDIGAYEYIQAPPLLKGDFNADSKVNGLDFTSFKNAFKSLFNSLFDLNSDNTIDVKDLGVLMSSWLP